MIGPRTAAILLAGVLIAAGLALWWHYGVLIVLAEPLWLCAPR